jgi:hypothetical protein
LVWITGQEGSSAGTDRKTLAVASPAVWTSAKVTVLPDATVGDGNLNVVCILSVVEPDRLTLAELVPMTGPSKLPLRAVSEKVNGPAREEERKRSTSLRAVPGKFGK